MAIFQKNSLKTILPLIAKRVECFPKLTKRIFEDYYFFSLLADRHHDNRRAGEFLYFFYVEFRVLRELVEIFYALSRGLPAGEGFIHRLAFGKYACLGRKVAYGFAFLLVRGADLYLFYVIQDVQLRHYEAFEPVYADRVSQCDDIKPAAPPRASGRGAVFLSDLAEFLALLAGYLGRERPLADPCRVGLCDAYDRVYLRRPYAASGGGLSRHRIAGRDERVRAEVNVEERALRSFEKHFLSASYRVIEE